MAIGALASAETGFETAASTMLGVAKRVASGDDADIASDMVTEKMANAETRASAAVVRAFDQRMGTLLDMVG